MSIGRSLHDEWDIYTGLDDFESRAEREGRMYREMKALRQARIEASRRVSPKGTYVPAKLAKAKRRVA